MNDETDLLFAGDASNGVITHEIGDDEYEFKLLSVTLEKRLLLLSEMGTAVSSLNTGWTPVTIPYGVWIHDSSMTAKMPQLH